MKLIEIIATAFRSLWQNKQRSFLTMIGIVIGISAVITILSLGRGFQRYTVKNLLPSGQQNHVTTSVNFMADDSTLYKQANFMAFSDTDLRLLEAVEGVESVDYSKPQEGVRYEEVTLVGKSSSVSLDFVERTQSELVAGRNLDEVDSLQHARVAIVDEKTAQTHYKVAEDALGHQLEYQGEQFEIVGIQPSSAFSLFDMDAQIKLPKGTRSYYSNQEDTKSSLDLVVEPGYQATEVTNQALELLESKGSNKLNGSYQSMDMTALTDGIGNVLSMLTYFISAIAGISLLIAGVGVMNMMYISVAERTKEIGIRRAMGAKRQDIRLQFLLEGVFLTLLGGIWGYLIGLVIAIAISSLLPFKVEPDFFTLSLALGVSSLIGIVFSVVPANKAAYKDLIEILK